MITIKLPIQNKIEINDLQRIYSSCLRFSYNRIKDGLTEQNIRALIKDMSYFKGLNTWLIQCAIKEAIKLDKSIKDKKVIFGGKKNWFDNIKGLITKEQFKESRITPIIVQGERLQHGNRLFELHIIDDNTIIFKPSKGQHIEIHLPKLRKEYKKKLYLLEELSRNNQVTYTISLSKTHINIIFDETILKQETVILNKNRVLGIDLNPNYIGYSILEFDNNGVFKIIKKGLFELNKLTVKLKVASNSKEQLYQNNKLIYEYYKIINYIMNIAKYYQVSKISIEDLNMFSKDHKIGKNYNRLCNNKWLRNRFSANLQKKCNIFGIDFVEVNPAYSSKIGNLLYGSEKICDPVAASIELARRGFKKYDKNWFYPRLNVDDLKDRWKETLNWSFNSWKELFILLKESKLKYRFPVENSKKISTVSSLYNYKSLISVYT